MQLGLTDNEFYIADEFKAAKLCISTNEIQTVKVPCCGMLLQSYFKQAGYCFVEFADREAARRAMLHINGKIIPKSKPPSAFNLSFANSPNSP